MGSFIGVGGLGTAETKTLVGTAERKGWPRRSSVLGLGLEGAVGKTLVETSGTGVAIGEIVQLGSTFLATPGLGAEAAPATVELAGENPDTGMGTLRTLVNVLSAAGAMDVIGGLTKVFVIACLALTLGFKAGPAVATSTGVPAEEVPTKGPDEAPPARRARADVIVGVTAKARDAAADFAELPRVAVVL